MGTVQNISNSTYSIHFPDTTSSNNTATATQSSPSPDPKDSIELSKSALQIKSLRNDVDNSSQARIKLVDEINNKIKYDGYPYEPNLYKSIAKFVTQDSD